MYIANYMYIYIAIASYIIILLATCVNTHKPLAILVGIMFSSKMVCGQV